MKRIIPFWERIICIFWIFMSIFIGLVMRKEYLLYGKGDKNDIIKLVVILLFVFVMGTITFSLLFIEYDEENDYICYSGFGRKFKARLSDVAYVGFLPFGIDGTYEIKYGTEKSFPFFCLFNKKKMLELYEAVKKKNPDCVYGF